MIEERSWFGTQLQSISKGRLLPTRDCLFGIIRRIERPLNSGICEKYGSCVGSATCLQNWLCGLAHSTVNIRNHKSPGFPEQNKRPCLQKTAWRSAHVRSLWVSSKATYAFSTFLSFPPPPPYPYYLPIFPFFSSYFGHGHLTVSNCGL